MNRRPSNRKKTAILLFVILLIVAAWASYRIYQYANMAPTIEIEHYLFVNFVNHTNLTLDQVLGKDPAYRKTVVLPPNGIYFYTLSAGWNFTQNLSVTNPFNYTLQLETRATGNISEFLVVDIPSTSLSPGMNETIGLTIKVPAENVAAGLYRGSLTIRLTPQKT